MVDDSEQPLPLERPGLRRITFGLPIAIFTALIAASFASPDVFLQVASASNDWILRMFGNVFAFAAFAFVLTCIWAFVSPLGKIRLGGRDAQPLLSRWNWFAITLSTTIAIGILFWATAEPIYHLYDTGGAAQVGSAQAQLFAMSSLYMHWAFTPYAIYTVPALAFALCYHNLKLPFSLSSPIAAVIGRPVPGIAAQLLDAICLLSLLFGLAASLGAGIMSISGGIDRITPLSTGPVLLALVAAGIVAAFFLSSVSGLQRGIRVLSDYNTKLFAMLAIFILLAGPTSQIVMLGVKSFGIYITEFIPRSLLLKPYDNDEWLNAWTVFYFANWMAWAPLSAMFLARIARGYTVREFIAMNLAAPAMFSVVWMMIFGGFAIEYESAAPGALKSVLDSGGPEFVLYRLLEAVPFGLFVAALFVILSFLSYVTAADSNTDVLARLSMRGESDMQAAAQTDRQSGGQSGGRRHIWIRLIWASLVGVAAWVMVSFSGIEGVKMLSNLGGFPALFVISLFCMVLIWLGTRGLDQLRG